MLPSRGKYHDFFHFLDPPFLTLSSPLSFHVSLKTASPTKQEQARLEVENAEDDLVQKTEVAITLMKAVLDNVCYILASVLLSPLPFSSFRSPPPPFLFLLPPPPPQY